MESERITSKSQPGWRIIQRRLFITVSIALMAWLLVLAGLGVAIFVSGQQNQVEAADNLPADVIIVLGSGLRRDGRPGDALYRRSVWGAQLYLQGAAGAVICTGGIGQGQRRSEAAACQEVMIAQGVPAEVILLEEQSGSTEENALYTRQIMEANNLQQAILVTDSFHMLRANWIFNTRGIEHYRSPVPREWVRSRWYVRHFTRELAALHWQAFKDTFNLPVTRFRRF